jgi:hypothetical protein
LYISGAAALIIRRLGEFGPEWMECTRLQEEKASDRDPIQSIVRGENGMKGCTTMLPDWMVTKLSDPARKSRESIRN